MFCTHNLHCYEYWGPHNMSGSMCQGSWSMLHTPSPKHVWHAPKSCLEMPRVPSTLDLGLCLQVRGWEFTTSERLPSGNWGRLTQHNFSCLLLSQDFPRKPPRAGHKVIWTVRSPHWFWRGRHIRCLSPWISGFAFRFTGWCVHQPLRSLLVETEDVLHNIISRCLLEGDLMQKLPRAEH